MPGLLKPQPNHRDPDDDLATWERWDHLPYHPWTEDGEVDPAIVRFNLPYLTADEQDEYLRDFGFDDEDALP